MRSVALTIPLLLSSAAAVFGQSTARPFPVPAGVAPQPGQLSAGPMRRPNLDPLDLGPINANRMAAASQDPHDRKMNRVWVASLLAVAGATTMDAATSWGRREGNGFLASAEGNFGARGVALKAAFAGAVILPEVLLRNHKTLRSKFILGNFAEAGIFTAAAIHNLNVIASENHP